jgi:hypothetical protein
MSRRGIGVLALLAVAVLAPGSSSAAIATEPATTPPSLTKPLLLIGPLAPLTVHGLHFKARERVTVTLDGGKSGVKHVVATRIGAFSAAFDIKLLACRTVTIRAVGSRGSRAVRQLPRPNCREP